jgi:hypothetical protein
VVVGATDLVVLGATDVVLVEGSAASVVVALGVGVVVVANDVVDAFAAARELDPHPQAGTATDAMQTSIRPLIRETVAATAGPAGQTEGARLTAGAAHEACLQELRPVPPSRRPQPPPAGVADRPAAAREARGPATGRGVRRDPACPEDHWAPVGVGHEGGRRSVRLVPRALHRPGHLPRLAGPRVVLGDHLQAPNTATSRVSRLPRHPAEGHVWGSGNYLDTKVSHADLLGPPAPSDLPLRRAREENRTPDLRITSPVNLVYCVDNYIRLCCSEAVSVTCRSDALQAVMKISRRDSRRGAGDRAPFRPLRSPTHGA